MYIRFGGGWRLLAGLLAGATVGAVMGQGFELIPSAVSLLAACTAGLIGVLATLILRAGTPRRERPSRAGATALMVLLASYLVVGRLVWTNLGPWRSSPTWLQAASWPGWSSHRWPRPPS